MPTRIAIISDIHANLPALEAVIEALDAYNPTHWYCLGDMIGYGPNPVECMDIIRERKMVCVLGNHDAAVVDKLSLDIFKEPNRALLKWTKEQLSSDHLQWLSNLPYVHADPALGILAAHAHPTKPQSWEYLRSAVKIREIMEPMDYQYVFLGHTHMPIIVADEIGIWDIQPGYQYMINPGAVGQPRTNDKRASAMLLDLDDMRHHHIQVDYYRQKVYDKLLELGYSSQQAKRLMGE